MNIPTPELDQLVLAMTHWLEAAQTRQADLAASARALDEAHRQFLAHQRGQARLPASHVSRGVRATASGGPVEAPVCDVGLDRRRGQVADWPG
jgi:hypothetical protein